jgi:enoyl-CoA hydratase/carnithine racemase
MAMLDKAQENLVRTDHDGVARLELNTPKSINALSESMLADLSDALAQIKEDRSIKVVILATSGDHFCAGHNLKEMSNHRNKDDGGEDDGGHDYFIRLFASCSKMMQQIVTLPQPVIAEVKGIATAAGCQLVASCDLAIAEEDARFATSGVNIGLFCSTPMVALTRNVSSKHAMEMLLTGEFISADRAERIGLINRVVAKSDLTNATHEMAQNIASKSKLSVKMGKEAFYKQSEMPLNEAYDFAGRVMADNMMANDAKSGIGAFIDKKPMPNWDD